MSTPSELTLLRGFALLLAVGACTACSSTGPTRTGFLPEYATLRPDPNGARDPVWVAADLPADRYAAFIVDPVAWLPIAEAPPRDAATVEALTAHYRGALVAALHARNLREVAEPGPGVLRVRAAITETRRAQPVVNAITTAAIFTPVTTGGASSEAELVDSRTAERVAALQGYNNGGQSFLGGPVGFFSEYGHARRALTAQADRLAGLVPAFGDAPPAAR